MDWRTLFLSAEGRIGRRDFWIGFALILLASILLQALAVLGHILGLLLIWPQVCIHAKRLHDMGRTAWLMLIPFGVGVACLAGAAIFGGGALLMAAVMGMSNEAGAAAAAVAGAGIALAFLSVAGLAGLAFLLWVGLAEGQPADNRFGPPPRRLVG